MRVSFIKSKTAVHKQIKWRVPISALVFAAILASCGSLELAMGGTERGRALFRKEADSAVGKPYLVAVVWHRDADDYRLVRPGVREYVHADKGSGCEMAYEVDDGTGIVLSWRYISDPQKCYVYTSPVW